MESKTEPSNINKYRWIIFISMCLGLLAVLLGNWGIFFQFFSSSLRKQSVFYDISSLYYIRYFYPFSLVSFLIFFGIIGDRFNRKLIVQLGLLVYSIALIYIVYFANHPIGFAIAFILMGLAAALFIKCCYYSTASIYYENTS